MSEKIRLDRKIGFQNTFYTKSINVTIDSIGPLIILRSIIHIDVQSSGQGSLKRACAHALITAVSVRIYIGQI